LLTTPDCSQECLEVFLRQFHDEPVAAAPAPAVTLDATQKTLAVVINFDERDAAERTVKFRGHLAFYKLASGAIGRP
jgi:hypothetical protein